VSNVFCAPAGKPAAGITAKGGGIAADKDEGALTLTATKQAPVGLRLNLIITGTLKTGKETINRTAPAIPVQVIAAQP